MAKIPINIIKTTQNLIENQIIGPENFSQKRNYMGFSELNSECSRKTWYSFRFASKKILTLKLKRIFERGDIEEKRIITDLKKINIEVFRRDDDKKIELTGDIGEEQEEVVGFARHAKGHPDGRLLNVPESPKTEHLLEIKTMNDSSFKKYKKVGLKEYSKTYWGQIQRLMRAMKLTRTLYIVTNKNDEERSYERYKIDNGDADILEKKEQELIISDSPVGDKFSLHDYRCKFCNHYNVCHYDEPPEKTCRSCDYVDLAMEGKWLCSLKDDKELSFNDQIKACKHYKRLF